MDIIVANDGAIQIYKNGVGQFYSPNVAPPSPSVDNSIVLTFGTTEIGKGTGDFTYCDHNWSGSVSGVTGLGTVSNPWQISVNLTSSFPGASVFVTYSYVNGREEFDVSVNTTVPSSNTQFVKLYHCIDTYLNGSDNGAAYVLGSSPYVFMGVEATTGGLYEGFITGNNQWDHFASEQYLAVNTYPEDGGDLSDNLNFNSSTDNGMAVQWDLGVVQGAQPEITYKISLTTEIPLPKEICGNGMDDNIDGRIDETYPAGIEENLLLWVKADVGFSGSMWEDQSPNGNDGTNVNTPVSVTSLNFHSGIAYDGTNYTYFNLPDLSFDDPDNHVSIFCVYKPSNNSNEMGIFGNQSPTGSNNIMLYDGGLGDGDSFGNLVPELYGNSAHVSTIIYDEEDGVSGSANSSTVTVNGALEHSFAFDENEDDDVNSDFYLGSSGTHASSQYFQGEILELIIYHNDNGDFSVTSAQQQEIETYLSLKYGITSAQDYVSNP